MSLQFKRNTPRDYSNLKVLFEDRSADPNCPCPAQASQGIVIFTAIYILHEHIVG